MRPQFEPAPADPDTGPDDLSAVLSADDTLYAVLVLDLTPDGNQACGIYTVANPDKLSHVD